MIRMINQSKIDINKLSELEVGALFLQYREGNREALERRDLEAMIDILLQLVENQDQEIQKLNKIIKVEDHANINDIFGESN